MATVVDALIMTLGLDTRDYDKGQKRTEGDLDKLKKQSGAVAKEMGEQGKRAAEFFSSIKTELLGLLAVFGAATGLKEFIASSVQGQASLGRLSRNLNVSAQSLQAWGLVAKEMGGQAEDAFGAMQAFAGGLAEASIKGHSALTDTARANGINLEGIKDSEEGLLRISKRLTELPRQQAMYLANELGVGGMFNQLELGPEELKKRLDAARGLTRVTAESTAAAERLQKRWADIQQRFKETSEIAFARLSPVLERLAERFANWLDSVDWDKVAGQIETLARRVNDVVQSFGGWKNVAIALGGVMALKVLAPVLGLIGGLTRLAPLLLTTTAGLAALAAAGAGIAGWKIGTAFYEKTGYDQTDAAKRLGSGVAHVLAFFGNQEAQEAIGRDSAAKGLPRGVRNRNPGNLNFAGQRGAHLESGAGARFAAFDSLQEGIAALVRQLQLYKARGIDTIRGIVQTYAPAKDGNNESAYIADLVRATGKNMDDHLDLQNSQQLVRLVQAIVKHEGNGTLTPEQIMGGVRLSAAYRASGGRAGSSSTSTAETHIGKIEVHTAATDAKGIAIDMRKALSDHALVAQADTGLN